MRRLGRIIAGRSNPAVLWNKATLQAIRETHPGPPLAARALALVHTCMYDAWAAYDTVACGTRLGTDLRRPESERTLANKTRAVSHAAYRALVDLFPSQSADFTTVMGTCASDPDVGCLDPGRPSGVGNIAAQAVLAFRHGDGSNQLGDLHAPPYSDYTNYVAVNDPDHVNDPNRWQPLRILDGHGGLTTQKFVAPHWSRVVPFGLTSASQFRPTIGPAKFLATTYSTEYRRQAEQILHYSAALDDRDKVIAEYWADGPSSELPPGHWCLFAEFVSERDGHNLDQDVKLYFALTNALFDAGIACWDAKRFFDSVRPITAIRELFRGRTVRTWAGPHQGTKHIAGESWLPYQPSTTVTPPFPEYFSGHSTFSAAAAEILKRFTGSDSCGWSHTQPGGSSGVEPSEVPTTDVRLTWPTFTAAADQAGLSRRFGGIHFAEADLVGRLVGRQVAGQDWVTAQRYIEGRVR